ncbi:hypothetical protein FVEG_10781 [Fusarium verticillioides 7600]|uniref:Uncharacterized protein n=1 Tax=Gibberella moniliformis (strain M3125 / FGSC 7600) TaxID=334819 RepID=W7MVW2_GIBM7|nr:hypothetical protein FVEG_10781 [Fusarium verticillioides 7600]EWG51934.1 hypothetical protein FVEG_10781 [Fusarium verticillioides 7600]
MLLRNRCVRMTIQAVTAPAFEVHQEQAMHTSMFRHLRSCARVHLDRILFQPCPGLLKIRESSNLNRNAKNNQSRSSDKELPVSRNS